MNKVIGIPGYKSGEHFGAGLTYLQYLSTYGDVRIIMPWEEYVEVDMLCLPGGLDTAPLNYGETPSFRTSNQDVFKEHFYNNRLDTYIQNDVPILGICLGAQMLAVKFGAKLTQHLLYHEQSSDRWKEAHEVYKYENPKEKFKVNSHHHQCLTLNNVNESIVPIMMSYNNDKYFTKDGDIVEQFIIKGKKIAGVQWHPEELYDEYTKKLVETYLLK